MKRGLPLLLAIFFLLSAGILEPQGRSAQEELFSLLIVPSLTLPLGKDADSFTPGGGASLLGRLVVPDFQYLYFEAGADYGLAPVRVAPGKPYSGVLLNLLSGRLGLGFHFPLLPKLTAGISAHGGYYYGFLNVETADNTGNNPLFDAGMELKYRLTTHLSLGVDASYRNFFGLLNDVLLGIGVFYTFPVGRKGASPGPKPNPQLELLKVSFQEVFPVFYKHYSDHPIGTIELLNKGKIPLEAVKVKVFVNQYMDNPYLCGEIPFITGGGTESLELFALFNDRVLEITENTKVQIHATVDSAVAGEGYLNELVGDLRIYDRNAMTWEDDRRAAAFVSMKDPAVMRFSKNVSSFIKDKAPRGINRNLLTALAFFETLRLHGLSYAIDPTTPFAEFSKSRTSVDFLQFPNQTLDYKAGDCDDLSILYCALLESVGIKSAFLTTPGHIFVAVSLDCTPAEARKQFATAEDYLYRGQETWLPVEITALSRGFLEAWQAGLRLWKEQEQRGQARLIVLRDAWQVYEPVGFAVEGPAITLPAENQVVEAYQREVGKLIDRELSPQTRSLEKQIGEEPKNAALVNRLGVLYARYGVYDKAEAAFRRAAKIQEYAPALVNLGNLLYLKNDLQEARRHYERAYARMPREAAVLLNLAKVNYELGRRPEAEGYYAALKALDARLAERYAYLGAKDEAESARAANADTLMEIIVWAE